jgi:hypothetical protein
VIAGAALALAAWAAARVSGGPAVLAGSALVALTTAPLWVRLRRDPLDGPGLYGLAGLILFGLSSLLWLGTPPVPAPGIDRENVSSTLVLVAVAFAAFGVAAWSISPPHRRPPLAFPSSGKPARTALCIGAAMALGGTLVGLATGAIGFGKAEVAGSEVLATSQLFNQVANVGGLVVLAAALVAFGAGTSRDFWILGALAAIQVIVGFLVGFKGASLLPVAFLSLAYISCRSRIPWKAFGAAIAITVVFLVPANAVYRDLLRPVPGRTVADATPSALVERTYQYAGSRFRMIDHVALIRARTPAEYPWGGGTRYAELPALITVPRALWPEKPLLDDGERFSFTYWEIPPYLRTSTPLTAVGDLYRNFGTIGALFGMLLWGGIVAAFTRECFRLRTPRTEMVYIAGLVTWVTNLESDLPQLIAAMSRSVPVAILVAWLLLPGRRGQPGYVTLARASRRVSSGGSRWLGTAG